MGVDLHGAAWALGMTESNQARQAMASLFTPNWEKGATLSWAVFSHLTECPPGTMGEGEST